MLKRNPEAWRRAQAEKLAESNEAAAAKEADRKRKLVDEIDAVFSDAKKKKAKKQRSGKVAGSKAEPAEEVVVEDVPARQASKSKRRKVGGTDTTGMDEVMSAIRLAPG